jgi:hypothetical protein
MIETLDLSVRELWSEEISSCELGWLSWIWSVGDKSRWNGRVRGDAYTKRDAVCKSVFIWERCTFWLVECRSVVDDGGLRCSDSCRWELIEAVGEESGDDAAARPRWWAATVPGGCVPLHLWVCEGRAASELVSFLCFDFFFLCQWGQADLEVSKIFRDLAIRTCPLGRLHMGGKEAGFKLHATISLGFTSEVRLHKWKECSPWMLSHSCFSCSVY